MYADELLGPGPKHTTASPPVFRHSITASALLVVVYLEALYSFATFLKKVLLVPIMMVAGDHATNDMAGSELDSHKSILEKEGFKVRAYIHGLGENPQIRQMFVNRANEAWDALQAK